VAPMANTRMLTVSATGPSRGRLPGRLGCLLVGPGGWIPERTPLFGPRESPWLGTLGREKPSASQWPDVRETGSYLGRCAKRRRVRVARRSLCGASALAKS
jgi:hypothetical protein